MDDSQKAQQAGQSADDQQQGTPQQSQQQVQEEKNQTPGISIPLPSKEGGPIGIASPEVGVSASIPEIEVSSEVQKETGMEAVHEMPQLTPEDTKAGIVHAKESVPVTTTPAGTITLPMTQAQAQQTVQLHKKVKDSLFWFAMLIFRQWQMSQRKKK